MLALLSLDLLLVFDAITSPRADFEAAEGDRLARPLAKTVFARRKFLEGIFDLAEELALLIGEAHIEGLFGMALRHIHLFGHGLALTDRRGDMTAMSLEDGVTFGDQLCVEKARLLRCEPGVGIDREA